MPTISMFFGILIRMNYKDFGEHKLPHFHAQYGDFKAVFGFDGEMIAGKFPPRQSSYVKAWALIHEEELAANWLLVVSGEDLFNIDPLK